jgi:hypothetical protein
MQTNLQTMSAEVRQNGRTPGATIEAVMFSVRERGVAALEEPKNIERLSRCDASARAEINRRIAALNAPQEAKP